MSKRVRAVPTIKSLSRMPLRVRLVTGFVVAMKAVLEANPRATPAEVEKGLQGNICRCGTYEQMRHAIAKLCGQEGKGG